MRFEAFSRCALGGGGLDMQDVDLPSHLCGFCKTRADKTVLMRTIGTAPPLQTSLPIRLRGGTRGFLSSVRPAPLSCTICGDYTRCRTTWFNRPSVCFHSLAAQYTPVLSSNRKRCPAPFVIPAGCRVEGGEINAVKCGDRKMSF